MLEAAGTLGFEVIREYIDRHSLSKLLGAFRNQAGAQPLHRGGSGTFQGPYYGIAQPSSRLTFAQFQFVLMELCLDLPDHEAEAIFCTIVGSLDGTMGFADLIWEIRAEPCDQSGRWGRRREGQIWVEGRPGPSACVRPTRRSGYSVGGYRPAPKVPELTAHQPLPPPPPEFRVAPTLSNQFVNGGNVLATHWVVGLEGDGPEKRKPPPRPVKTSYPRNPTSAYPSGLLHGDEDDGDRWSQGGVGQRRPPQLPFGAARVQPPQRSGYTAEKLLDLGVPEPPAAPSMPQPLPVATVLPRDPWTSGYNRGQANNVLKEAWAEKLNAPASKPLPPEVRVASTLQSGFTTSRSICATDGARGQGGLCAFCRMTG